MIGLLYLIHGEKIQQIPYKLRKILKVMGLPDHLTCLCETDMHNKQQLEPDKEQWTGSKLEKEYFKTILSPCLFNFYAEWLLLFSHSVLSLSISSANEYPGFISFRTDWLDLLAVQGILKSLLQHHSSKAPILQCSAFFMVQLSHPYMTTEKAIALTICTFALNVMSWYLIHCLGLPQTFFQGARVF